MSGRNGPNDREQRARERERIRQFREQQILNAIAQQVNRRANPNPNNNFNNNNNVNINNNNGNNNQGAMNNVEGQQNPSPRVVNVVVRNANGEAHSRYHAPVGTTGSGSGACKRKSTSYGPESVECWASSEIEQETFAFLWTLKNFSAFQGADEIKSPCFKGGPKSNHSWQLKMSPRKKVEDTEYFSVHLILFSFGDGDVSASRKVKVRFQISLVDPDGKSNKQAGSPTMNVCEFKRLSVWGYDKFITTAELFNPVRRLVEDDTLKIHCRVWIEGELKHTSGLGGMAKESQSPEEVKLRRMELLSQDMKSILDSNAFADVALSTKTKTFLAHKSVLAARSRVFQAMFHSEMVESTQNAVEISDFEDDVVKAMLEYMYSGETPALSEKAPDLMQIAEKYELMGLKEDCEHAIAANLTIENAAEVLVLAHLHSAIKLKPKVIEFINRNKEEVRKTDAFTQVAQANAAVFVDLYLSQK